MIKTLKQSLRRRVSPHLIKPDCSKDPFFKLKPLKWKRQKAENQTERDCWKADSVFSQIRVTHGESGFWFDYELCSDYHGPFKTTKQAKEAAEINFQRLLKKHLIEENKQRAKTSFSGQN